MLNMEKSLDKLYARAQLSQAATIHDAWPCLSCTRLLCTNSGLSSLNPLQSRLFSDAFPSSTTCHD